MKVYIRDKVVKINKDSIVSTEDTLTSKVYRYGNLVIKIFNGVEDENFYRYFVDCNLKLNVISTPIDLVFDKKNGFIGNTSKYINGIEIKNNLEVISNLNKEQLLFNLNMLKSDILTLKQYNILANDLRLGNCIFKDGVIYHIDYGNFYHVVDGNKDNEVKINIDEEYNRFVCDLLGGYCYKIERCTPNWIIESDDKIKIIDNKMKEYETAGEFLKRYR